MTVTHSPPKLIPGSAQDVVTPGKPAGVLLVKDVAALWSRIAHREIKPTTVRSYLKESHPMVGDKPGRYADNPMPQPRRLAPSSTLWWPAEQEKDLIEWYKARPTQSHGKGRQAPGPRGPNPRRRKETS